MAQGRGNRIAGLRDALESGEQLTFRPRQDAKRARKHAPCVSFCADAIVLKVGAKFFQRLPARGSPQLLVNCVIGKR